MTFFVILMFSFIITIAAGILVYNIYTIYEMQVEFSKATPHEIFMAHYAQICKQRKEHGLHSQAPTD